MQTSQAVQEPLAPAISRPAARPHLVLPRLAARVARATLPPAAVMVALIAGWWAYVALSGTPPYLVPSPGAVFTRWSGDLAFYYGEGMVTIQEALSGLALGGGLAIVLGALLAHSRPLERGVLPVAIALKVTPVVAVAPLFTIWFGFGMVPKILIAALVAFFPLLINAITGFRAVNPSTLDLLRALHASPWAVFWKLRLPSSLPYLFAALKVSLTLSLIGAMVAEWSGAGAGLGRALLLAHANLDMPSLFAGVFTLATLGVALTGLLTLIERRLLFWHESYRSGRPDG